MTEASMPDWPWLGAGVVIALVLVLYLAEGPLADYVTGTHELGHCPHPVSRLDSLKADSVWLEAQLAAVRGMEGP